jgi:hypothetical protein
MVDFKVNIRAFRMSVHLAQSALRNQSTLQGVPLYVPKEFVEGMEMNFRDRLLPLMNFAGIQDRALWNSIIEKIKENLVNNNGYFAKNDCFLEIRKCINTLIKMYLAADRRAEAPDFYAEDVHKYDYL